MEDIMGLFHEMIGSFVEKELEGELEEQLGYSKYDYRNKETDNSRNGHSEKTLRTSYGDVGIQVPRDRKGEFEPELVKKQQTTLSGDIEEKILSMYAKGMTTGDIEGHIREIYVCRSRTVRSAGSRTRYCRWCGNGGCDHWKRSTRWYTWTRSIST